MMTISHGLIDVLEKLKVEKIIIGNQFDMTDNYKTFEHIVNEKGIEVQVVKMWERINIENELYFYVIWPSDSNQVGSDLINNNSLVVKMIYRNFSMLFTADIEKEAEKQILKNDEINLTATILKVAHHGSKSSTTDDFLNAVNPQIAIIGVGKNNNFGHPATETIEKLENKNIKIYRTDEDGEIEIKIKNDGYSIETCSP